MSGLANPRRTLVKEWGYLASVFMGLFLTALPFAISSPGHRDKPHISSEKAAVNACFLKPKTPNEIHCPATPEENPFDWDSTSLRKGQNEDSMELFLKSLHGAFGGA